MMPSQIRLLLTFFSIFFLTQKTISQTTLIKALYLQTDSLIDKQEYKAALIPLQKIIQTDSLEWNAYNKRALIYADLKQYDSASKAMMWLADRLPDYPTPNLNAGWFCILNKDFENGKKYSFNGTELQSINYTGYLNTGHAALFLKQTFEASYYYKNAAQYLPDSVALENAKADFVFFEKEGLLKKNNGVQILQYYFDLFKPNKKASVLLDSIYRLIVHDGQANLSEKVLQLKARFIDAELTYPQKRWWVMRDFMWDVGEDFYNKRNYTVAFSRYLSPVEEINNNTRDSIKQYLFLKHMVSLLQSSSDYKGALAYSKKQLAVAEQYGFSFQEISSLISLGDLFDELNMSDSAIIAFKGALRKSEISNDKRNTFLASNRLYIAYATAKNWDSLMHYYTYCINEFATSGIPRRDLLSIKEDLARNAYEFKKYKESLSAGLSCLAQIKDFNISEQELSALHNIIGKAYYQLGQKKEAEINLKKAVAYYKEHLKTPGSIKNKTLSPLLEMLETFPLLERIAAEKNIPDDLFSISETIKGNSLYYLLTAQPWPEKTIDLKIAQQTLKADEAAFTFTQLAVPLLGTSIAFDQHNKIVNSSSNTGWSKLMKDFKLENFRDKVMKTALGFINSAATKTSYSEAEAGIVAVFHYYAIGNNGSLQKRSSLLPGKAKESLTSITEEEKHNLGRLFYNYYFKPFESILKGKKKLYICPDGVLNYLPAELFINDEGKYLGELYDIVYVPSFTLMDTIRKRPMSSIENIVAFGNPDYTLFKPEKLDGRGLDLALLGFTNWSQLPGTEKELSAMKAILPKTIIYQQEEISESIIQKLSKDGNLSDMGIIHFALHGLGNTESNYEDISLITAEPPGGINDGFLQFEEIAKMNIKARLVCISACESAMGSMVGEDNLNLSVAFMIAGAHSVVASAWRISDEATTLFMSEVYKNIYKEKTGLSEAFHLARKKFINGDFGEQYKSPYYWAPFRYTGY
jgi:CHAT domain-containing protein